LTPDGEGSQGDGFGLTVAGGSVAGSGVGAGGVLIKESGLFVAFLRATI